MQPSPHSFCLPLNQLNGRVDLHLTQSDRSSIWECSQVGQCVAGGNSRKRHASLVSDCRRVVPTDRVCDVSCQILSNSIGVAQDASTPVTNINCFGCFDLDLGDTAKLDPAENFTTETQSSQREEFENGFSTANAHESTRTKRIMPLQDYRTEHLTSDKPALGRSLSPTSVFSVSLW